LLLHPQCWLAASSRCWSRPMARACSTNSRLRRRSRPCRHRRRRAIRRSPTWHRRRRLRGNHTWLPTASRRHQPCRILSRHVRFIRPADGRFSCHLRRARRSETAFRTVHTQGRPPDWAPTSWAPSWAGVRT